MANEVALFVTCLIENMRPKIGFDAIRLLEDAGFNVLVPGAQVCCGQPNYNSGDKGSAIKTARHVIDTFLTYERTVVASGSCAGMLKHHYPQLLADDEYRDKAVEFAGKVYELSQLLVDVDYKPAPVTPRQATYHDACAGLRELDIRKQPRILLEQAGVSIQELSDTEVCCGFGGTFCVKYPDVSGAMLGRKLQDIQATETDTVILGDLGCILNIEGGLSRTAEDDELVAVQHFAEVLAEGLAGNADES